MIQPNEVRLGNYFKVLDKICRVDAVFKTHIRCVDSNGIDLGDSLRTKYNPIPLSPEILENNPHPLRYDLADEIGDLIGKQIKYVHQYQNVIFALTGTELEIKL